jgi:hypothetical protein
MKPEWKHDCTKCRLVGQTIGGGRLVDLYLCGESLVARYGSEGNQYYSSLRGYPRPDGHAELWALESMLRDEEQDKRHEEWLANPDGPQAAL